MGGGVQSVGAGAVSPANTMNSATMSGGGIGIQSPHQPGMGLKPGTQTPPANVLQVVKQVQEEAARQQAPHVGYGKVNPTGGVPGQSMPPPQIQRAMGHLGTGQGKLLSMYFFAIKSEGKIQGCGAYTRCPFYLLLRLIFKTICKNK